MKTLTKYGILIVVSNRLYLVLVIGSHTRYGGIDTYLPREGPETHHKEEPSLFQQGIYRHLSTSRGDGN